MSDERPKRVLKPLSEYKARMLFNGPAIWVDTTLKRSTEDDDDDDPEWVQDDDEDSSSGSSNEDDDENIVGTSNNGTPKGGSVPSVSATEEWVSAKNGVCEMDFS